MKWTPKGVLFYNFTIISIGDNVPEVYMATKKQDIEFRMLDIPVREDVLALLGSDWIREYGFNSDSEPIDKYHFHNLMEIGVCRWGTGFVEFEERRLPYKEGSIIIIPRKFLHNTLNQPGTKSFWEYLYVDPASFLKNRYGLGKAELTKYVEQIEKRPFLRERDDETLLYEEINLIMNQIRIRERNYIQCVRGLVYSLLMEIVKINYRDLSTDSQSSTDNGIHNAKLEKVVEYIDEHFAEDLKISDLARYVFISETHLRTLFAEYYDITPLQYINQVRIKNACTLLLETDMGVCDIGYRVGYQNQSTFLKNFKKAMKDTPKKWKNKQMKSIRISNKSRYNIAAQKEKINLRK